MCMHYELGKISTFGRFPLCRRAAVVCSRGRKPRTSPTYDNEGLFVMFTNHEKYAVKLWTRKIGQQDRQKNFSRAKPQTPLAEVIPEVHSGI